MRHVRVSERTYGFINRQKTMWGAKSHDVIVKAALQALIEKWNKMNPGEQYDFQQLIMNTDRSANAISTRNKETAKP